MAGTHRSLFLLEAVARDCVVHRTRQVVVLESRNLDTRRTVVDVQPAVLHLAGTRTARNVEAELAVLISRAVGVLDAARLQSLLRCHGIAARSQDRKRRNRGNCRTSGKHLDSLSPREKTPKSSLHIYSYSCQCPT